MQKRFTICFFLIVTTVTICEPCHSKRETEYIVLKTHMPVKGKVTSQNKEFIVKFSARSPDNCKIRIGFDLERINAALNNNNELESALNDALDQAWQTMLLKLKPEADQEQFENQKKDGHKQFEEKCKQAVPRLISIVKASATKI